jgi:hypothetical protein
MNKDRRYSRTIKKARTVGDGHANSSSPRGTIPYVRRENTNLSARSHLSKIPAGPITNCQTAHLSLSLVSSSGRRHPSSLRAPGRRHHRTTHKAHPNVQTQWTPPPQQHPPVAQLAAPAAVDAVPDNPRPAAPAGQSPPPGRPLRGRAWEPERSRSHPEAMDGVTTKLVTGDAGYVLEDVPHLSDYLPDLPVSAAVPRGVCIVLRRSMSAAAEQGAVDRSIAAARGRRLPMPGVPLRWG